MTKICILLGAALSLPLAGMAQQLSPSVLAASAGTISTQTMVLDWTLGELVVETATSPDRLYTQGFHQPLLQVSELDNQTALAGVDATYTFTIRSGSKLSANTHNFNQTRR